MIIAIVILVIFAWLSIGKPQPTIYYTDEIKREQMRKQWESNGHAKKRRVFIIGRNK